MSSNRNWTEWCALLKETELPLLVVDLEVMKANIKSVLDAMQSETVAFRLFVPELPCPALLRLLLLEGSPHVHGLACNTAQEAGLLTELGFNDILVLNPVASRAEAHRLATLCQQGHHILSLVDCEEHLELLSQAALELNGTIHICIDVDINATSGDSSGSVQPRSPIRDSEQARSLAQVVKNTDGVELEGIHVADPPHPSSAKGWLNFGQKRAEMARLDRRLAVVHALRSDGFSLSLVSAGHSRSLEISSSDPAVSELHLGCSFLGGSTASAHLGVELPPAAFLALPVSRRPDDEHAICTAGSFAQGVIQVHSPLGLQPSPGTGSEPHQLLFSRLALAPVLHLSDPVLLHAAHPGQLMVHFDAIYLIEDADTLTRAPTLRGL